MRLRFGDAVFDSGLRELSRGGSRVPLTPKAFALLERLVEARPAPVSREVLTAHLWPGTFVEEGNLHNLISEIRRALGDEHHEWIRTVHRFGYAFEAAGVIEAGPVFTIQIGREEIPLRPGENIIGRDPSDAICLAVPEVSRHHARLVVQGGMVTVEDLGSKNGTFVRSKRVSAVERVEPDDEIVVGTITLRLRAAGELPSTRTIR